MMDKILAKFRGQKRPAEKTVQETNKVENGAQKSDCCGVPSSSAKKPKRESQPHGCC